MGIKAHSGNFRRSAFIIFILLIANPCASIARGRLNDFNGRYSKELKDKIDRTKSRIHNNLKSYRKDKSVSHLDESYDLIIQSTDEVYACLRTTFQQVQDIPEDNKEEKIRAQIDKLEMITIKDTELPYLCNQLYEVGRLYVNADKKKAKQCFSDIVTRFTSYESESCNKKAELASKNLK